MNTSEWEQSVNMKITDSSNIETNESVLPYPTNELVSSGRIRDAEAVINRVMEVAESNHTIERILERRHEVKDIAAKDNQNSISSTESNGISSLQLTTPTQPIQNKDSDSHSADKTSFYDRIMTTQSLYGHAVRYGFFSALLALLIAVIVVNLFT